MAKVEWTPLKSNSRKAHHQTPFNSSKKSKYSKQPVNLVNCPVGTLESSRESSFEGPGEDPDMQKSIEKNPSNKKLDQNPNMTNPLKQHSPITKS